MTITEQELRKMTATALKEWAQENTKLAGVTGMKKDELLTGIFKELGIEPEEVKPVKKAKIAKKASKIDINDKSAVKGEISRLRDKKEKLLEDAEKNYNQLKNLRRRIRYLKRVTKKVS